MSQFIVADRGGNAFALALPQVLRVTMSPQICEAPLMPPGYLGVIDFEGNALPVWDPFPESGDAMWGATVIVAEGPGGKVGILSDAPPRVASGDDAPAALIASRPAGPMWESVVKVGEEAVPVLDPSRFEGDR